MFFNLNLNLNLLRSWQLIRRGNLNDSIVLGRTGCPAGIALDTFLLIDDLDPSFLVRRNRFYGTRSHTGIAPARTLLR
jgi:hypothetical protein